MRTIYILVILVLLTIAVPAATAHAGGVVTVCDEAHLLAALASGGTVTFACSGTITLTNTIAIAADTTIDGSGQAVTISGNDTVRVLTVNAGVTLNLNRLTVANGSSPSGIGGEGGAISNRGTVIVSNSTVSDNSSGEGAGGIFNLGTLTVSNSTFSDNHANGGAGGGITNIDGTLTVTNSTFSGNRTNSSGGGIYNSGTLTVSNSTFSCNSANGGGGIYSSSYYGGTLTVSNSTFSGNSATWDGGGIFSDGALSMSNSTFIGNSAGYGGGISFDSDRVDDTLTITDSTFSNNNAGAAGGAIYNEAYRATVTVNGSTFSSNHAGNEYYGEGGGIFNRLGTITIGTSTFTGNSAFGTGGGVRNSDGTVTISNSTFTGNTALYNGTGLGGGIYTAYTGSVTVDNSTFANNRADYPGSAIMNIGSRVTLGNTVVVAKASGENCYGTITDGGGNLSYPDTTCPGINADPMLGPLQMNGGPTLTMEPGPGSAAIDAGIDAICAAPPVNNLDQRGITRPAGAHCDIGAVERLPFRKWLPTILSQ